MAGFSSTAGIVALAAAALAVIALGAVAALLMQVRRLRADQTTVIGEGSAQDLVAHAARLEREYTALAGWVQEAADRLDNRLKTAEARLDRAITYRGLVRYDAYNEMSGRQSTSIALLDDQRSGVVVSSITHRDQARVYAKQVTGGVGELQLSPEEEQAVKAALSGAPPADA